MLDAHPTVAMSQPKEVNYFNVNYERGEQWYRKHFSDDSNRTLGEISPWYMDSPEAAARIRADYPETRRQ